MDPGWRQVEDAALRARNSFKVPARARRLIEVHDAGCLPALFDSGAVADGPLMVLGGGSNILFAADPPGTVLSLSGRSLAITADDGDRVRVRADAGVVWHDLVMWTLGQGLAGLENLALIPGTVGAAPIQNIGAYGVEVGEHVHAVEAFDRDSGSGIRLGRDACAFAYRDSHFKRSTDRYVITSVEFDLSRNFQPRLGYADLAQALAQAGIQQPTCLQVAEAVCNVRRRKLPDPDVTGNAGSFFKNPIVPLAQAQALLDGHPALPVFPGNSADTRKLSAAWLIDTCGWKGFREGDAGVSSAHALVLVNHGAASGAQLLDLARRIAASVQQRFQVPLEPEPRIVGANW